VNAAADTAASETDYTRGFVLQSFVSTQKKQHSANQNVSHSDVLLYAKTNALPQNRFR